ncbi:hypothetical protein [Coprobacillus cateniformis]|uniref:hypothetical protein n=2 Tax=Coprobacillaceae TaxID=2810280 RepID=UPI0039A1467F
MYQSPIIKTDDGDTPTPYLCTAPIVGLAVYAAIIADVVAFINWGGIINLALGVYATVIENDD